MKILLVEDDLTKGRRIRDHLSTLSTDTLVWVRSVTSAIIAIDESPFDLLILDMSLPTFDEGQSALSGGRQQNFGGREVLAYIDALEIALKTIIVTQYPDFEEDGQITTTDQIDLNLRAEFSMNYLGLILYRNNEHNWQDGLTQTIYKHFK